MVARVWNGSVSAVVTEVRVLQMDGSTTVASEFRAIPKGYPSSSSMLTAVPFYCAHRGSSDEWPEFSLMAYTRSAVWGAQALEISVSRTSDGVWFGLHDATLLRTSGVDIDPTAITWRQLQNYRINPPPGSPAPPQPYMRLEELTRAYGKSHVILLDPKNKLSIAGDLLDFASGLMDRSRIVGKYAGTSTNFARACRSRGIKSWGFYYGSSFSNVALNWDEWDILGLDHTATQEQWNEIKSYGKPVMGHIVGSAAEAATALSKGADGLMVSAVEQVIARRA